MPLVEDNCVYPDSNNKKLEKQTRFILACYFNTTKRCNERPEDQRSDCYVPKEYRLSINVNGYPVEIVDIHNEINDGFNECVTDIIKKTNFECYDSEIIYTKTWKLDESMVKDYENKMKDNINYQWLYSTNEEFQKMKTGNDNDDHHAGMIPCYSDNHKVEGIFQKYDPKIVFADCLLSESGLVEVSDGFKKEETFKGGEKMKVLMEIDKTGNVHDVIGSVYSELYGEYENNVFSCVKDKMLKWNFGEVEQACIIGASWRLPNSVKSE